MPQKRVFATLLTILTLATTPLRAQQKGDEFGVAYYNVDRLYDTLQSDTYNDRRFTPSGSMRWDSERYARKINNIIEVIDSLSQPVVVLYGVENEQVARDLASSSTRDYAYIHHDQNISNGLEFAVLYQGDIFLPEKVTRWQRALCIEGSANGTPITLIANARCPSIGALMAELGIDPKSDKIILVGQPSKVPVEQFGLHDATLSEQQLHRGNYVASEGWIMRDKVATNIVGGYECGVYIKDWLLDDLGKPLATFEQKQYRGGYSSSLPVYIYFEEFFAY